MNRQGFRATLVVLTFAVSGSAMAIGLGDVRGQLVLGDQPALSVNVLGVEGALPDVSCFRLVKPRNGDQLPWLRDADLRIKPGQPPVLLINGGPRVRDPVVRFALHIACGHEIHREYTLFASPSGEGVASTGDVPARAEAPLEQRAKSTVRPQRAQVSGRAVQAQAAPRSEPVRPPAVSERSGDRLLLSAGAGDDEAALRLDAVLGEHMLVGEVAEAQREILRLEYRMLAALHEQANSQLAAAEKLRGMESALDELQGKTLALTEKAVGQVESVPPVRQTQTEPAVATSTEEAGLFSSWWFYGLLLGLLVGLAGWLFSRSRHQQRGDDADLDPLSAKYPEPVMDAPRVGELHDKPALDLHLDSSVAGTPQKVDVELLGGAVPPVQEAPAQVLPARPGDSVLSINATTLDEHFEANPVMELADIMLSFGRVKGAAQALQEYIDNNPSEALQPWIRLMDVYRMAGMREEFDAVARNLNQQFNVEVQSWDAPAAPVDLMLDGDLASSAASGQVKPQGVEDMPRIISSVIRMWDAEDVVGYLYQLLRDNRGGQRQGFALPVVEEILFLIELKETSNRMEKEKTGHA